MSSFFKIILCSTLRDHKLRIPDKFAKKYGDELSDFVKLMAPTGGIWCVKVEKTDKSIWLDEGMHKLIEDHCIRLGYLLIFKYKGNSTFKVRIFDLSALEIDYPNTIDSATPDEKDDNGHHDKIGDENSDDDSIEILGSPTDHQLRRSGASAERWRLNRCYLTRSKKRRIQDEAVPDSSSEANRKITSSINRKNSSMKYESIGSRNSPKEDLSEKRPIQAANISLPKNPCYSLTLKSYNICKSTIMYLPNEFAQLYMSKTTQIVKLQDADHNEWEVHCYNARDKQCFLSKGWRAFVRAKNLMVGDVCVFEPFRKNEEVIVKVKICRGSEYAANVN